jgi:prolyl 4-hydroxylase
MKKIIDHIEALKANGIIVVDNFLSISQCIAITDCINNSFWLNGRIAMQGSDLKYYETLTKLRTNKTYHECFFSVELRKKISQTKAKIHKISGIENEKFEPWQLSKYQKGDHFHFHLDCGSWKDHPSGEREKTVLLYLNSPIKGGETYFRGLNLLIKPIQGRLVIWDNLLPNGNCNHAMIHAGLPVKFGVKITLNTWIRQKKFLNIF